MLILLTSVGIWEAEGKEDGCEEKGKRGKREKVVGAVDETFKAFETGVSETCRQAGADFTNESAIFCFTPTEIGRRTACIATIISSASGGLFSVRIADDIMVAEHLWYLVKVCFWRTTPFKNRRLSYIFNFSFQKPLFSKPRGMFRLTEKTSFCPKRQKAPFQK